MIKFNKHNVRNTVTNIKAKIYYSLDNRVDKRKCVTLYAKDYDNALKELFGAFYENDTDTMTDYFEKGSVDIFEENFLYKSAREMAEKVLSR